MLAFARGDAGAFDALYERHRRWLYRVLRRQLPDDARTDDAFQETWYSLIRSAPRYEPKARFTTWLYLLARQRIADSWRASNPEEVSLAFNDDEELADARALDAIVDDVSDPARLAERRELATRLVAAIDQLPAPQREALLLFEDAGDEPRSDRARHRQRSRGDQEPPALRSPEAVTNAQGGSAVTDPRTPGQGQRPLRALLDEAPGNEPPPWLDANIRAEAARAAELARQRAGTTPGVRDTRDAAAIDAATPRRARLGWIPIGATMAVAVLGLLLVIGTPVQSPAPSPPSAPPSAAASSAPAPVVAPTPAPAGASTAEPESRSAASADARVATPGDSTAPAVELKKESAREELAAPAAPAERAERAKAAESRALESRISQDRASDGRTVESGAAESRADRSANASAPQRPQAAPAAAPQVLGRARDSSAEPAAPESATKCVEQIDELRRGQRVDEAKRLLRVCRERFPDHDFPAELVRELAP